MFPIRDHNPSGRRPFVTIALLAANILVFFGTYPGLGDYQLAVIWYSWGVLPARLAAGEGYETLLTHMFLHGGWMHLIGNMLFLWIFGDNLEAELGHFRFLSFYIACGLAAAALQILPDPRSEVPMVGASGAIAGLMGGYLLLYPKARVDILVIILVFFKIFTLPAWVVLGSWFALQMLGGFTAPTEGGGTAYLAHIGGFIAGLVLIFPLWQRLGGTGYWSRTEGHPPHPEAAYPLSRSSVPKTGRRGRR